MPTNTLRNALTLIPVLMLVACGGGSGSKNVSSSSSISSSRGANYTPLAADDNFITTKNILLAASLADNDTGLENTPVIFALAPGNNAVYGALSLSANGSFTYTPSHNFIGEENFFYQITDSDGDVSSAQVAITVGPTANEVSWPSANSAILLNAFIEAEIADLVARMTLAEKIGQMTQAEIQTVTAADIRQYHLGSVLNGGGSSRNKIKMPALAIG